MGREEVLLGLLIFCVYTWNVVEALPVTKHDWQLVGVTELKGWDYAGSYEGIATDEKNQRIYLNGRYHVLINSLDYQLLPPYHLPGVIPLSLLEGGYNHLGDGDIFGGIYYAGIERENVFENATLIVYDAVNMTYITNQITNQTHMPWVAVQESTQWIYSAQWDPIDYFIVYDHDLQFLRNQYIVNATVSQIQGGDFYEGVLYVSSNDDNVYVFDVTTSEEYAYFLYSFPTTFNAEMEGISFLNLRDQNQGMLHILDGNAFRPNDGESKHALYHYDYL